MIESPGNSKTGTNSRDIPYARAGALGMIEPARLLGADAGRSFEAITIKLPADGRLLPEVQQVVGQLTPAGVALLAAVQRALLVQPRHYAAAVRTGQIARALGRADHKLLRHDRNLLTKLIDLGLVREKRQPLQVRTVRGAGGQTLQRGAGYELIYSIPERVLYALLLLDHPEALKSLPETIIIEPSEGRAEVAYDRAGLDGDVFTPVRRWRGMTRLQVVVLVLLALALLVVLAVAVALLLGK